MVPTPLPRDFREFLRLLNEHEVHYLVIGGHAVGIHGYVRYTGDLDIWVAIDSANAIRITSALREFGFDLQEFSADLFQHEEQIIRMSVPPLRIEIHTLEGIDVPAIGLSDLKANKSASGRLKDKLDLENLHE